MSMQQTQQKTANELNPVLVLYLRRMVRNGYVLLLLSLYVIALTVITGLVLFAEVAAGHHLGLQEGLGSDLTGLILLVLAISALLSGLFFTIETSRGDGTYLDILFTTPLDETDVGVGKTLAGTVLTALFFAVTMPFLTIAWLLGGVDFRVLFTALICIFLDMQIINAYSAAALFHRPGFEHRFATYFGLLAALPITQFFAYSLLGLSVAFSEIPSSFEGCFSMLYGHIAAALAFYFPIVEMYRVNFSRCSAGERLWVNMYSAYVAGFFVVLIGGFIFSLLYAVWKIFY